MNDREERIRQRAYDKWQKDGETHGWHDRHWNEAESEISSEDDTTGSVGSIAADETEAASATPMMDDAGTPESGAIEVDSGAKARSAAASGTAAPTKRRSSGGKTSSKKKSS